MNSRTTKYNSTSFSEVCVSLLALFLLSVCMCVCDRERDSDNRHTCISLC